MSDEAVRAGQWDALVPFQAEGGDNPYTIQQDLQETMNDLVGIIRTAPELEDAYIPSVDRVRAELDELLAF